ncbi:MAG: alpha/beta hydrolase [Elusimicrobia bacterium]|nr:MAG: alpha/beta hydrolase [Elusimicrobiota bacterium]
MKLGTSIVTLLALTCLSAACGKPDAKKPAPLPFETIEIAGQDDVDITADLYKPENPGSPKTLILLFHQAGTSRGEYRTIAPRLTQMGFHCLAVDQRSGEKDYWNNITNLTAEVAASLALPQDYAAAYKDLKSALDWSQSEGYENVLIWGSSYSSALVFKLASQQSDPIKAVLSFSPGEYIEGESVSGWAKDVNVPVYIAYGSASEEKSSSRPIFDAVSNETKEFKGLAGRHGSSVLMENEGNWSSVLEFLKPFAPAGAR